MSYIEINNINFYNDINSRKEFIENILDDTYLGLYLCDPLINIIKQ